MILDKLLEFSIAQALTTTAVSANAVDLAVARDLSVGDDPAMEVFVHVGVVLAGGTSVQVQVMGSTDDSTYYMMAEGPVVLTASLTAGANILNMKLPGPASGQAIPRYLKLNYVIAGTFTSGTVNAYLVLDRQRNIAYPPGITIAS